MPVISTFLVYSFILAITSSQSTETAEFESFASLMSLIKDTDTYTLSDVERLIHDKLHNYSKLVRPKLNNSKPLDVKVDFSLISMRDFDEIKETLSVVAALDFKWIDEKMAWNSSAYGGVKTIITENSRFWTPTFVLMNSFEKLEKVGEHPYWPIRYIHTGHASFTPVDVFTATCAADVTFYPWDVHTCKMDFITYAHIPNEIQLFSTLDKMRVAYYEGNGEWDLIDTDIRTRYGNLGIEVQLTFKRKPLFIVVNVILPIVLMSVLNTLAFLIPVESGERISFGMAVVLATAVFLTIIGDSLPKTARSMAVLCYFLVSLLVLSILIMFGLILNVKLFFRSDNKRVPKWCAVTINCLRCKRFESELKKYSVNENNHKTVDPQHADVIKGLDSTSSSTVNTYQSKRESVPMKTATMTDVSRNGSSTDKRPGSRSRNCDVTWQEVSSTLDTVFFIISWLVLSVCTLTYFGYVIRH